MKPKVSIIVPIYNMESYLTRCLNSLVSQSLIDIEIIAVNDGSTDATMKILNEYASKDRRIKVINKKNGGVSSARNAGIHAATGEYIGFVDPDDWVDYEMYETLYRTAVSSQSDTVMCSYMREFGTHSREKVFNSPHKVTYINEEVKKNVLRRIVGPLNKEIGNPELLDAWGTVWSKLYRAEVIKSNHLQFEDLKQIGTNEDSLFNIQAIYHSNSFTFLNSPLYHYWRANTTSVTSGYKPELVDQWFHLYKIIETFLENKKMGEEYYIALNNRICLNLLGLGLNSLSEGKKFTPHKKIKNIKLLLEDYRIKRSFQQFDLSHFPIVWRAFYLCAKLRFASAFYFMLISIDVLRKTVR
ncbi:glycosyltransferase family 2 protein [Rossellomorea vietnamensis]|uniref:Glycosyl transferase family 2 n=1 Tax=Rossellomorea vietnamensis TaxID=218284 RepID=A0A0P6WJ57_9BACI|nr:glycosyltransferase [Rossellomorea vietnamensis]KPL57766.1 glycosyl transferase family 2 [Rossellomorea vietnamensis]